MPVVGCRYIIFFNDVAIYNSPCLWGAGGYLSSVQGEG